VPPEAASLARGAQWRQCGHVTLGGHLSRGGGGLSCSGHQSVKSAHCLSQGVEERAATGGPPCPVAPPHSVGGSCAPQRGHSPLSPARPHAAHHHPPHRLCRLTLVVPARAGAEWEGRPVPPEAASPDRQCAFFTD